MRVQVFQLFFKRVDGAEVLMPWDGHLHELAVKFAADHMTTPIDFLDYKHTWVACEVDEQGKPARVLGLLCMVMRPDFVVCRFTDNAAVVKLVQRANDFLHDSMNLRGTEVLVYIQKSEPGEEMCPNYMDWMKLFDMKEADRWTMSVR